MKNTKITYFLLLAAHMSAAMQNAGFTLDEPYFDSDKEEYVIEALSSEQKKIGSVSYHPSQESAWILRKLEVDYEHRKKGIARTLLAQCIKQIKKQYGTQLSWQIYPKEIGMNEDQLIKIYYQMLKKINFDYFYKTNVEYRGYGEFQIPWMILDLK